MSGEKFENLMKIMYRLRKECPWDQEQTHESIKSASLEEVYELIEAIDEKNYEEIKAELGDILLHIVFHSVIAEEENNFTINDVIDSISEKLVRRHPHVFGDVNVKDSSEIMKNWEMIKLSEGRNSVLEGVPKQLPGLHRAFRLQEKASKVGFDWDKKELAWDKFEEEIGEFQSIEKSNDKNEIEKEAGDVIFAFVNYLRFLGINPENALRLTNEKFIKRFNFIEDKLKKKGTEIGNSNLEEMDKYWEESKKND